MTTNCGDVRYGTIGSVQHKCHEIKEPHRRELFAFDPVQVASGGYEHGEYEKSGA